MGAFGIPLSGLVASQEALQSISNNLANLNTVGYKDESTSFADLFARSSSLNGANEPLAGGLGVRASQTVSNYTDGSQSATGISSNMALAGNGFFVVKNSSGATEYTRAGDFTTNASGQLITPGGDLVLGYAATNGVVSASSALQPLQVQSATLAATATSTFNLSANLNAGSAKGATFSSTVPVFDSLGQSHELTVDYTNQGGNSWSYSVNVPTSDTGAATSQIASGTLSFDTNGNLTAPTGSIALTVPSLKDGAAPLNVSWSLQDASGNPTITQTSLASGTTAITQNGFAAGTLTKYTVQANGTIEGTFSNGQNQALGQVALAGFANVEGLDQLGGNLYQATTGAGAPILGTAQTGGFGTITGGEVESSNVDVATEFSRMIVAQQAYQSNARVVTTFDQLVQTTMQMMSA